MTKDVNHLLCNANEINYILLLYFTMVVYILAVYSSITMLCFMKDKLSTTQYSGASITKIHFFTWGKYCCVSFLVSQISDHGDLIKNIYSKS